MPPIVKRRLSKILPVLLGLGLAGSEINVLRGGGAARGLLDGQSRTASPGALTDTVRLDPAHPWLTVSNRQQSKAVTCPFVLA